MPRYAEYLESGGLWIQELVGHKLGRPPQREADPSAWESIAIAFLRLTGLRKRLAELGDLERDFLSLATFSATGATDRELLEYARRQGAERHAAQEALYNLSRSGLIMCSRAWSNEIAFVVPDDLATRLIALRQQAMPALLEPSEEPPRQYVSEELALHRDLYTLLTSIEKEPLQITQQTGLIYKRQLEKLVLPRLEVQERMPADGHYPPRFAFLFEFCMASMLLNKTKDGKVVASGAAERWFRLTPLEQAQALYSFWSNRCLRAGWRYEQRVLMRVLQTCQPGVWYRVGALNALVQAWYGKPAQPVTEALRGLAFQSLVDLDTGGAGGVAQVRITPLGARVIEAVRIMDPDADELPVSEWEPPVTRTFFLQPNFEVLVPRTLDLSVRYRLDQVADLTRADTLSRYRITDSSVQRALERGWQDAELIEFLAVHSETPLPQNVRVTLEDWADRFGRIAFWDVLVMRVRDRSLARELKAHPNITPYLHGELSPTALICHRKDHPKLVAALKEHGYWPQLGIVNPDPEAQAPQRAKPRDLLLTDFAAGQRLPMAVNQQIPRPAPQRRTGPLRKRDRGGRDLPSTEVEALMQAAISEGKPVEIEYFAPATGRTRRTIEPRAMVGDQVEAFCHLRSEDRRFTLTNILEIWVME